jgi:hypothetical protein
MNRSLSRSRTSRGYNEIFVALILVRFVLLALLLIFLVPKEDDKKESNVEERNALRIEINWENGRDVDVDIWAKAPGDKPVGWTNKGGKYLDLVRDDLGHEDHQPSPNYEITYGRKLVDGEYIVNLYLWANREKDWPVVPVKVDIYLIDLNQKSANPNKIFNDTVQLNKTGQEVTVLRFNVVNGVPDKTSFNSVYRKLYGVAQ